MICFLKFCNNFGLNCKNNFSFYKCFCMAWEIGSTITWNRFYCFLACESVPKTKSVTTLMKHSITYWSQMKNTLGNLKITTTVIVALIPNIMMIITLFQLQLTFHLLSSPGCQASGICCTGRETNSCNFLPSCRKNICICTNRVVSLFKKMFEAGSGIYIFEIVDFNDNGKQAYKTIL